MIDATMLPLEDTARLLRASQQTQSLAGLQQALADGRLGDAQRLPLLLSLAQAQLDRDDEAALASAAEAGSLAESLGHAGDLGQALCLQSQAHLNLGLAGPAFDEAALALAQGRGCNDLRQQARALRLLAECERIEGNETQAGPLLDDSLACAQGCGDLEDQARAWLGVAMLAAQQTARRRDQGDLAGAAAAAARRMQAAAQACAVSAASDQAGLMACALGSLARAHIDAGQAGSARPPVAECAALAKAQGWYVLAACARLDEAMILGAEGRAALAIESLDSAEHHAATAQCPALLGPTHETLGELHKALGDYRHALVHLEALARLQRHALAERMRQQARVLLARLQRQQSQSRDEMARLDILLQAECQRAAERERELLRRHANEDALTGLGNRRAADAALARHLAANHPTALALARVDIDHFRAANDLHGPAVGDALLQAFGTLLRELLREGDEVFRLPGEGFLVLFRDVTPQAGREACERLCRSVQCFDWHRVVAGLQVTASLGLGLQQPGDDAHSLQARADTALYAARRAGGNRVVCG